MHKKLNKNSQIYFLDFHQILHNKNNNNNLIHLQNNIKNQLQIFIIRKVFLKQQEKRLKYRKNYHRKNRYRILLIRVGRNLFKKLLINNGIKIQMIVIKLYLSILKILRIDMQILNKLWMKYMIIWNMKMKMMCYSIKIIITGKNLKDLLLLKQKRVKNYNISDVFIID